jgi:hypothetical protein
LHEKSLDLYATLSKSVIGTLKKSGGEVLERLTGLIGLSSPPQTASATTT